MIIVKSHAKFLVYRYSKYFPFIKIEFSLLEQESIIVKNPDSILGDFYISFDNIGKKEK